MAREHVIASLDIGNSKIRCIIAIVSPDQKDPHIVGVGYAPSLGLRKGAVSDIEELVSNVSAALEDAERMSGITVHHVFVGTSGHHIESLTSRGVVATSGKEVSQSDMARVVEAAQSAPMPRNNHIMRVIPRTFSVDDQHDIRNPIGMTGIRLEVEAHVITGNVATLRNLERAVHQAGVDIDDIIPSSLAAAEAVLTKRQKELGVIVVDMGAVSTSVIVYEEGTLLHSAIIPVGGESVTKDVAIGLRSSIDAAERMKIEYGSNITDEIPAGEEIDLSKISKLDSHFVSRKHLSEIIQARYFEIFELVKQELRIIGREGMLPAGAILSGSAIKMPGTLELAREVLALPVQIGFPQDVQGMVEKIDDPAFATAIGLIFWGMKTDSSPGYGISFNFSGIFSTIGKLFKKLLP